MCGILGYISKQDQTAAVNSAANIQKHRGPDAQGFSRSQIGTWNIHLAHQRLSVIDLTAGANQPFADADHSLIFNGEIYNYLELKAELAAKGVIFKTQSDTEVVFESIRHHGLEAAVKSFNGMWAFAFLDKKTNILSLSRDRFGIKPLNYFIENDKFIFASEIKTVLHLVPEKQKMNLATIASYLQQSLLEADPIATFFGDIKKLAPGHNATIDLNSDKLNLKVKRFYKLSPKPELQNISFEDAKKITKTVLVKATELQLRSDVPVGILLSGGLDSSGLTCIASKEINQNSELLSFVSESKDYDESKFIDKVADHVNRPVKKVKIDIRPEHVFSLLKTTSYQNDQPLHSFSAMAHYLLMEKAKQNGITVILSGQGADESLCGYRKYLMFYLKTLFREKKLLKFLSVIISFLLNGTLFQEFSWADAKRYLPHWLKSKNDSILSPELKKNFKNYILGIAADETLVERQIKDFEYYSVPSLLHYEERMSMAHAREVRVPYLDHNVVETFISFPNHFKLNRGWTKYILRESLADVLPKDVAWRKDKKGFTNPQKLWLKNELKADLERIFNSDQSLIYQYKLVDKPSLLKKFDAFCNSPKANISEREIFAPLALNIWLEQYKSFLVPPSA